MIPLIGGEKMFYRLFTHICQQSKLMIQKNHTIKGARVLVLGITFKENCPDLRNSKVIDVIQELKEFGIEVSCFDPQTDAQEVQKLYNLRNIQK